jgi:hypothetical protein
LPEHVIADDLCGFVSLVAGHRNSSDYAILPCLPVGMGSPGDILAHKKPFSPKIKHSRHFSPIVHPWCTSAGWSDSHDFIRQYF